MYKNIIDKKWLIICQAETNPYKLRLSWFKDNHFQTEYFIDLKDEKDSIEHSLNFDVYLLGSGKYATFYCDYRNEYLIIDYCYDAHTYTRIYNLKDLYNKYEEQKQGVKKL